MNGYEAWEITKAYNALKKPTDEDDFMLEEAWNFLIETDDMYGGDDKMIWAYNLACHYMDVERYDLATRYFKAGFDKKLSGTASKLGYICYYGLNDQVEYESAFYYLEYARTHGERGMLYLLSDMYRDGKFVEKDRYEADMILDELCEYYEYNTHETGHIAEVYYRSGLAWRQRGEYETADEFFRAAEMQIKGRMIADNSRRTHREDIDTLLSIQRNIYGCTENFKVRDLYDVFYLIDNHMTGEIEIRLNGNYATLKLVVEESGELTVFYDDRWFREYRDFLDKADLWGYYPKSLSGECIVRFRR